MNQLLRQTLLACVCLLAMIGHSRADSLADARQASAEGNHAKAAKLYKTLAEKGNAVAQLKLATMYYSGNGVSKSFKEAVRLYRLSAEQGNVAAQSNLATMYYRGDGVPRNFILAHMWKNIAATNTEGDRQLRYFEQLEALAKDMSAQQINKARELAKKCTASKFKGCMRE